MFMKIFFGVGHPHSLQKCLLCPTSWLKTRSSSTCSPYGLAIAVQWWYNIGASVERHRGWRSWQTRPRHLSDNQGIYKRGDGDNDLDKTETSCEFYYFFFICVFTILLNYDLNLHALLCFFSRLDLVSPELKPSELTETNSHSALGSRYLSSSHCVSLRTQHWVLKVNWHNIAPTKRYSKSATTLFLLGLAKMYTIIFM